MIERTDIFPASSEFGGLLEKVSSYGLLVNHVYNNQLAGQAILQLFLDTQHHGASAEIRAERMVGPRIVGGRSLSLACSLSRLVEKGTISGRVFEISGDE